MPRTVTKGADGFFRVSGMDEDVYYASQATANRVAAGLDKKDAEKTPAAPAPTPPPKK